MKYVPKDYQNRSLQFLLEHERCCLFLDPGLGKTGITLSAMNMWVAEGRGPFLVIAPLRPVYSTWPAEIEKWDHTRHLSWQILHGKTKTWQPGKDIYLVNPEGLNRFDPKDIGGVIVDESSKFKTWTSKRTKTLRKMSKHFDVRVLMTGTPAPKDLEDLFPQIWVADQGKSFGNSLMAYRNRYFHAVAHTRVNGRLVVTARAPNSPDEIYEKAAPVALRLDGKDYLDLPPFIEKSVFVNLPRPAAKVHKSIQDELFAALEEGQNVLASNAASAYIMARQVAGGAVYDDDGGVKQIHTEKIDALADLLDEIGHKPTIVVYNFIHELTRLKEKWPNAPHIGGDVSASRGDELVKAWNNDEVPLLLVHPITVSHGLNMQHGSGRHIVWFSLTDNLETYLQLNRRIHRMGVKGAVFIYHILARNTVDEAVMAGLKSKERGQNALLKALKEYRERILDNLDNTRKK